MPVILARIDDRLIHGQVTVGWSERLRPDRILLANNAIAADPWQTKVYSSTVPPQIEVSILPVSKAVASLAAPERLNEQVLLLAGSVGEMAELVRIGVPVREVNVGGLHFGPGKREMLPFVYVDRQDLKAFVRLLEMGMSLSAQQVPGGREYLIEQEQIQEMGEKF
jgi:mannose/fructose/N-acetylgalactosamine-specific phosphotransferase system component IIB